MLKWIGGGCLVLLLIACAIGYAGYRKMKSFAAEGPTASVMIHASPERVFASISTADSLSMWRNDGARLAAFDTGALKAGDSIKIESIRPDTNGIAANWIVETVVPNTLVVMRSEPGRSGRNANFTATRRDSISAVGDSTRLSSTFEIGFGDPTKGKGMGGMATSLIVSALRLQASTELTSLKERIERAPPAVATPPVTKGTTKKKP